MKRSSVKNLSRLAVMIIVLFITGCAPHIIQVDYPKPSDYTAKVNGYTTNNAGQSIIKIIFNYPMDINTVVVTKTLKLHFSKDANTAGIITWSADKKTATVTTAMDPGPADLPFIPMISFLSRS